MVRLIVVPAGAALLTAAHPRLRLFQSNLVEFLAGTLVAQATSQTSVFVMGNAREEFPAGFGGWEITPWQGKH